MSTKKLHVVSVNFSVTWAKYCITEFIITFEKVSSLKNSSKNYHHNQPNFILHIVYLTIHHLKLFPLLHLLQKLSSLVSYLQQVASLPPWLLVWRSYETVLLFWQNLFRAFQWQYFCFFGSSFIVVFTCFRKWTNCFRWDTRWRCYACWWRISIIFVIFINFSNLSKTNSLLWKKALCDILLVYKKLRPTWLLLWILLLDIQPF